MQLKKHSAILLILLSIGLWSQAQIISLFKKLDSIKRIKDTSISLKYFKKPDAEILNNLDSFFTYLSAKRGINIDSNFYCQVYFTRGYYDNRVYYDKPKIVITYRNDYASYRVFTEIDKGYDDCVFAFFFYKEKLVVCTITSSYKTAKNKRIFVSDSDFNLVKNLMYEQMSVAVKKEIDTKPDTYTIVAPAPLKAYFLKE